MSESVLDQLLEHAGRASGVDLTYYRRDTLRSRLTARMDPMGMRDPALYLSRARSDAVACAQLMGALAVNVSSFFRDPIVFELLAQLVVPELLSQGEAGPGGVRAWSAGCSTGEEAYSVSILFAQELHKRQRDCHPLIFATDINEASLRTAAQAVYRRETLQNTKLGVVDRYFLPRGDVFEVHPEVRQMVRFSRHDVTDKVRFCPADSVFGGFDLVLCRNLLIYLNRDMQELVVDKLCRSMRRGGYLVLGQAEALAGSCTGRFRPVDARSRVFQKL